jgi:hypothetical protein
MIQVKVLWFVMPYSVVVGYIVFEDSEDGDSKVL